MIIAGFESDKGKIRDNNEDCCLAMPKEQIYMVADGVGGNRSGEVASKMAVNRLKEIFAQGTLGSLASGDKIREYLQKSINQVNTDILTLGEENKKNKGMATTLVICYVRGATAYIVNVGDSRAYLLRNRKLVQLTEDHTYHNAVIKGIIEEEKSGFQKNMDHAIFRALGAENSVEGDIYETKVRPGDVILLCTDGLYGEMSCEEIETMMNRETTMSMMAKQLVATANLAGGHDNITAVCLKITGGRTNG